ncbi:hypothetical protein [Pontibacter oryzae]|uniref:Uncharacterized protein n=1 Tax=Pontibacter oryzae TaxID=2304593 RepID=A0A399SLL9_9BACT|nr:hypothetical protein [Pontibacter oryzae]RIJ42675.1 hypothetical protein D1627_02130 [Pontibacter oryzae]
MNEKELVEFINRSDRSVLKEYLDSLKAKIETINTRIERILLLLLLTFISYFLIQDASISNINLGIIELSKAEVGTIMIPPVFAFLYFYYAVLNNHLAVTLKMSKVMAHYLLYNEIKSVSQLSNPGDIILQFLPFSFLSDLFKISLRPLAFGCIFIILALPILLMIGFIPFWFEYFTIRYLIENYWGKSILIMPAVIVSTWFAILTVVYIIKFAFETQNLEKGNVAD